MSRRLRHVADWSDGMSVAIVTHDLIVAQTRALKLPGVARTFDSLARQALTPIGRTKTISTRY